MTDFAHSAIQRLTKIECNFGGIQYDSAIDDCDIRICLSV
jgi:hypothetical protein